MTFRTIVAAVMLIMLSMAPASRANADGLSRIPAVDRPFVLTLTEMTTFAYGNRDFLESDAAAAGWTEVKAPKNDALSGLKYAIYERVGPDGKRDRVVVFAGTDLELFSFETSKDFLFANITQYLDFWPTFLRSRSWQYHQARELMAKEMALADKDPNLRVSVAGHSLGGGLAQYVSAIFGIKAVVVNSAGLSRASLGRQAVFDANRVIKQRQQNAKSLVYNIQLYGDMVSRLPFAFQTGIEILLHPTPDAQGINHAYAGGWTLDSLTRHSSELTYDSLKYALAYGLPRPPVIQIEAAKYESNRRLLEQSIGSLESIDEVLKFHSGVKSTAGLIDVAFLYNEVVDGRWVLKYFEDTDTKNPGSLLADLEQLDDAVKHLKRVVNFTLAAAKDQQALNRGEYTFLSSHTLEELYKLAVDKVTSAEFLTVLQRNGTITKAGLRRIAYFGAAGLDIFSGVGMLLGRGGHRSDAEGIVMILHGVAKLSGYVIGLAISGGNPFIAALTAGVADFAFSAGKMDLVDNLHRTMAKDSGRVDALVGVYLDEQSKRRRNGETPQSWQQAFDNNAEVMSLLTPEQLADVHARAGVTSVNHTPGVRIETRRRTQSYREICVRGVCYRKPVVPDEPDEPEVGATNRDCVGNSCPDDDPPQQGPPVCIGPDCPPGPGGGSNGGNGPQCPDGSSPPCGPHDGSSDEGNQCPDGSSPPCDPPGGGGAIAVSNGDSARTGGVKVNPAPSAGAATTSPLGSLLQKCDFSAGAVCKLD